MDFLHHLVISMPDHTYCRRDPGLCSFVPHHIYDVSRALLLPFVCRFHYESALLHLLRLNSVIEDVSWIVTSWTRWLFLHEHLSVTTLFRDWCPFFLFFLRDLLFCFRNMFFVIVRWENIMLSAECPCRSAQSKRGLDEEGGRGTFCWSRFDLWHMSYTVDMDIVGSVVV